MPANLNALIRYKTINSCLYGGKRKWSIRELIEACSEALGESRGRYNLISERTLRDDLRVMRSDILGFNAPIEQENGLYFYADPQYSILTLKITDAGLAERILGFLTGLRTEIQHPELEAILEQLCQLTNKKYEKPPSHEAIKKDQDDQIMFSLGIDAPDSCMVDDLESPNRINRSSLLHNLRNTLSGDLHRQPPEKTALSWGDVFAKTT
jgi:hypothetical protein